MEMTYIIGIAKKKFKINKIELSFSILNPNVRYLSKSATFYQKVFPEISLPTILVRLLPPENSCIKVG